MFRRRDRRASSVPPPGLLADLRMQVLDLQPAAVGLEPTRALPRVWGALMETGYPKATATLVAVADGTTSLYTSASFGIIGGGQHPSVAAAAREFLHQVETHLDGIPRSADIGLPDVGQVVLRALTYSGRRAVAAPEDDLGNGRHPMSPVFYAGHDVITQLRLVEEAGPRPG